MFFRTILGITFLSVMFFLTGTIFAEPQENSDIEIYDTNWPTLQHDLQRTGQASVGVGGDANCVLTLNHRYQSTESYAGSLGPIIYDGKVVAPFNDSGYAVFDLTDISTPLYTLSGLTDNYGYFHSYSVPSIFEIGGTPYLFLTAGILTGIRCYDFSTVPATLVWEINEANNFRGHPMIPEYGTELTNFILLNDGTQDVLFFTTYEGYIYAAEALTGDPYSGWDAIGNEFHLPIMGYSMARGFATDGINKLFIDYFSSPKGGLLALDAFSGGLLWHFHGLDFKGSEVYGTTVTVEWFDAGIAFDWADNAIYAVSTCLGDYPVDGVLYKINASDGSVIYATAANRMRYAQTPVVGVNLVYCPSYSSWAHPPIDPGAIQAFRKYDGIVMWVKGWGDAVTDNRFYTEILLTDETSPVPAQLFAFSDKGYLHCLDAYDGTELFNRRIDYGDIYGSNIGGGGAVAVDPDDGSVHVVFQSYIGDLYDLTRQTARPRLNILDYNLVQAVSFGSNTSYPVVFEDFYTNTGCVPLNVTIDIYDASSGSTPVLQSIGPVSGKLVEQARALAENMSDAYLVKTGLTASVPPFDENIVMKASAQKAVTNPAALAAPAFVAQDHYVMPPLGAGESQGFILLVNETQLVRGMQTCYGVLTSNDPDFFLNDPTLYGLPDKPEVKLNIFSGCLTENVALFFGESQGNYKYVSNSGRLGDGDWDPHLYEIDGLSDAFYQGSYIYGTSKYQLAMNSKDWNSHSSPLDGEEAVFRSLQADPNFVSYDCSPALSGGVNLGKITYDSGQTYTNLYGNMVYTTVLDSVQNWSGFAGWDWRNVTQFYGPFDDTLTMGLTADIITIGVYGEPMLNGNLHNCVIKTFNFKERNGRNVDGWYMGSYQDTDEDNLESSSGQGVGYDASISTGWTYNIDGSIAVGAVKIPFGCGQDPLINAVHFYGSGSEQTGFWEYAYWDSAYSYMANHTGAVDQPTGASEGDGESHYTLVQHDFEPGGEYRFAAVNFQMTGLADNASGAEIAKLAHRANKFMGWGRGDVNDDGDIDLVDIVYLINYVYKGGPGPQPFEYLGNMEPVTDGAGIDLDDIMFLIELYFENGPCPEGLWKHVNPAWDADDL